MPTNGKPADIWSYDTGTEMLRLWRTHIDLGTPVKVSRNSVLFSPEFPERDVLLIGNGIVRLSKGTSARTEQSIGLRFIGQLVDPCTYPNVPLDYSATTICPCTIYRLRPSHLRHLEETRVRFATFMLHLLRVDVRNTLLYVEHLKQLTPLARFRFLLALLEGVISDTTLSLRLPDTHAAELIGCSPRHLKRIKSQLGSKGIKTLLM